MKTPRTINTQKDLISPQNVETLPNQRGNSIINLCALSFDNSYAMQQLNEDLATVGISEISKFQTFYNPSTRLQYFVFTSPEKLEPKDNPKKLIQVNFYDSSEYLDVADLTEAINQALGKHNTVAIEGIIDQKTGSLKIILVMEIPQSDSDDTEQSNKLIDENREALLSTVEIPSKAAKRIKIFFDRNSLSCLESANEFLNQTSIKEINNQALSDSEGSIIIIVTYEERF